MIITMLLPGISCVPRLYCKVLGQCQCYHLTSRAVLERICQFLSDPKAIYRI